MLRKVYVRLARAILLGFKACRRLLMLLLKPLFACSGRNVLFNPFDSFTYSRISIGNDVYIGAGAVFHATDSAIRIGNKVMFGPNVTIMGGDHNTSAIGRYMFDVKEKRPEDDRPVTIEDDVWIGANVTILKGVTIGTGAIVGAGSVVARSIPPYMIAAGVPAQVRKCRFEADQLRAHLAALGRNSSADN